MQSKKNIRIAPRKIQFYPLNQLKSEEHYIYSREYLVLSIQCSYSTNTVYYIDSREYLVLSIQCSYSTNTVYYIDSRRLLTH